jgi:hypothetical protein
MRATYVSADRTVGNPAAGRFKPAVGLSAAVAVDRLQRSKSVSNALIPRNLLLTRLYSIFCKKELDHPGASV